MSRRRPSGRRLGPSDMGSSSGGQGWRRSSPARLKIVLGALRRPAPYGLVLLLPDRAVATVRLDVIAALTVLIL